MRPSFASVRSSSGSVVPLHRTAQPNPTAVTLDDWKLVALLGQSETSRVYASAPLSQPAADLAACDYAVKQIMHPNAAMLTRFRREVALGKSLSHPHLMPTLAANTEHETPYLVMPRVHGYGLHTILDQHGPCSIGRTLWIARQLTDGLAHLHHEGWVHADVKPGNVMIAETGHVTLLDLGLAVNISEAATGEFTAFHGTVEFAAPELFLSRHCLTPASDIYSLGVSLYQLLTGRLPFGGSTPAQLAEAHLRSVPPSARTYVPQLPTRMGRLLERMLAKEPARRPATDGELQDELLRIEIDVFSMVGSTAA